MIGWYEAVLALWLNFAAWLYLTPQGWEFILGGIILGVVSRDRYGNLSEVKRNSMILSFYVAFVHVL